MSQKVGRRKKDSRLKQVWSSGWAKGGRKDEERDIEGVYMANLIVC